MAQIRLGVKPRFIIVAIPLAFCLLLAVLTYRQYRQQRLDHDLIAAIKRNDVAATLADLRRGADPNVRDSRQSRGVWQILRRLFLHSRDDDEQSDTALIVAIHHLYLVQDPAVKRQAAISGIVPALLQAGADPNIRDESGEAPLMMTVMWEPPELIQCLLDHKANVNARGFAGSTPLMLAVPKDRDGSVKLLLEHGAEVNARMDDGMTPLMVAAGTGAVNNMRLLLLHHADIHPRDKQGLTALQWAQHNNEHRAVQLLKSEQTAKHAK